LHNRCTTVAALVLCFIAMWSLHKRPVWKSHNWICCISAASAGVFVWCAIQDRISRPPPPPPPPPVGLTRIASESVRKWRTNERFRRDVLVASYDRTNWYLRAGNTTCENLYSQEILVAEMLRHNWVGLFGVLILLCMQKRSALILYVYSRNTKSYAEL